MANNFEEGQGSQRAIVPVMIMMMMMKFTGVSKDFIADNFRIEIALVFYM
jgi:hypothetical protein